MYIVQDQEPRRARRSFVWATLTSVIVIVIVIAIAAPARAAGFDVNRALNRPAIQTTTVLGGVASRADDGNIDGAWPDGSVTHTDVESQPYWQVDLGASYPIDTIDLYNRTDCCRERLSNLFVFFSNVPMTLRGASDTFQQTDVQARIIWGQAADHQVVSIGQTARYIRVQLSGDGNLSLAEVKALQHIDVEGPPAFATATSWVATGVYTNASAFSLVDLDGSLQSLQRGFDGLLHIATDVAIDRIVPGSPLITANAPSVAVDPATNRAFVAVRGQNGLLYVATGEPPAAGAARTWAWQILASTEAPPSVIVAGGHVVVGWLLLGQLYVNWMPVGGNSWTTPSVLGASAIPPTLARNKQGAIGVGFARGDGSIGFVQGTIDSAAHWGAAQTITGWTNGTRIGVAAWGDLFLISALGGDARPYVAVQQASGAFNGFEPAWGATDVALEEAPTLSVFDGVVFLLARDQTGALRYWIRNPNTQTYRYAAGQMWLGGRIVGGWGTGATPPAVASIGHSTVWGVWGSPSEYYVGTRGIGDQQIYTLNLGRFTALDILNGFGISLRGNDSIPWLDVRTVKNLFEHMVAFLALPGADAWTANARNPSCAPAQAGVNILLHPDTAGQTRGNQCPPVMFLNSSYQSAFFMFHEWMHMDHARRGLAQRPDYAATFGNDAPRLCQTSADCGGDPCINADSFLSQFDDPTIRQWDGKLMCVIDGRPQGHASFYGLESSEHDFIEAAQLYRWSGEELKQKAIADINHGNLRLWNMYIWFLTSYFDGIQYTGTGDISGEKSNRNWGWWGTPIPQ